MHSLLDSTLWKHSWCLQLKCHISRQLCFHDSICIDISMVTKHQHHTLSPPLESVCTVTVPSGLSSLDTYPPITLSSLPSISDTVQTGNAALIIIQQHGSTLYSFNPTAPPSPRHPRALNLSLSTSSQPAREAFSTNSTVLYSSITQGPLLI